MDYTLNIRGKLVSLRDPQVMGIVNVTPNSFYPGSRVETETAVRDRVHQIVREGGKMIDVGACSTNPFLEKLTTEDEELSRLEMALPIIREASAGLPVSVDTFRARVARVCIDKYGVDIVNDISTGEDPDMFRVVAETGTPYILMSQKNTTASVLKEFAEKVGELRALGQKDIILDPGYGFGKTMDEHFRMLRENDRFGVMGLPVLVGISRKRVIYQTFGFTSEEALNGTTVLNTVALMKGADILRVHDVAQAVEAVTLVSRLKTVGDDHAGTPGEETSGS